jgi:hypothetical protein
MSREIRKLSARTVETLRRPGRHSDGGGRYLSISKDGRRRWTFLYRWKSDRGVASGGAFREMGLGSLDAVSLAKAREIAGQCRAELADGINPIEARNERLRKAQGLPTFGKCVDELLDAKEGGWRSEKHLKQWRYTLEQYAGPLRPKLVDRITTEACSRS